ncbi:D-alanine--D-alanine ligase family protein [Natronogracilivirga saccharolytica]|uniref:ATP-grasp domain-containing protein n=1 Tax=Natronogracilivirga saccharolytica TaxID=2812953 RepID=A0A8J7RL32_9BACT|nr:hypothetical protein [Natronogracilivirga saccharolytica]MBP3192123.1 hypothetical protein [Natronogracilivirga saccharolytica]
MHTSGKNQKITSGEPLMIGLVYDRTQDYQLAGGPDDKFAEFEPESTIAAMEQAVTHAGHRPLRIGSPHQLLNVAHCPDPSGGSAGAGHSSTPDLVWNIGEGYGSRNREAWAPVICEMKGIPCLGSDAYALTVTLDKVLTKMIARSLGVPTSDWQIIGWNSRCSAGASGSDSGSGSDSDAPSPGDDSSPIPEPELPFPQFLKPRYEGTSKGISEKSMVRSPEEFRHQCRFLLETYHQDVMAEPFIDGPEITCALSGHPLRAHPVMERGLDTSGIGSHALETNDPDAEKTEGRRGRKKSDDQPESGSTDRDHSPDDRNSEVSGIITPELEEHISSWSLTLCNWLRIRDFVRLDFKIAQNGTPLLLEINPLPTFATDSTFAILAEIEGRSYPEFLSEILRGAIGRLKQES